MRRGLGRPFRCPLLRPGTDLLVVCSREGALAGVLTKTDVVGQISHCQGCTCVAAASLAMSRDVFRCGVDDQLQDVWAQMKQRGLKNVPIADAIRHPRSKTDDSRSASAVQ